MRKSRTGWRVCVGTKTPDAGFLVKPLYPNSGQLPQPAKVGSKLTGTHHVGTTKQFVLDYYTGCCELKADECELILELKCPHVQDDHKDRWGWPVGSEALATHPSIVSIEVLEEGPRE